MEGSESKRSRLSEEQVPVPGMSGSESEALPRSPESDSHDSEMEPSGGQAGVKPEGPGSFAEPGDLIPYPRDLHRWNLHFAERVHSPTSFVMLSRSSPSKRDEFVMEMTQYYNRRVKLDPAYGTSFQPDLRPGLCVAVYKDWKWLRAKILYKQRKHVLMLETFDYGTLIQSRAFEIRFLNKGFLRAPAFALRCMICLNSGFPYIPSRRNLEANWQRGPSASERFHQIVKQKERYMFRLAVAEKSYGKWMVDLKGYVQGPNPLDLRYVNVAHEMLIFQWRGRLEKIYIPFTAPNGQDVEDLESSSSIG